MPFQELRFNVRTVAYIWVLLLIAASAHSIRGPVTIAQPRSRIPSAVTTGVPNVPIFYGEAPTSRTLYTILSLISISILTGMLGYRARQLERYHLRKLSLTRVLVLLLHCLAIAFVLSTAVTESGLGLSSAELCHAAIIICLIFYVGSKMTMYIFLVERAHALRAPYMRRGRDWIWLGGIFIIACGFGSTAICGFMWPLAELSHTDGRCRIGLPYKVTIPILSFDIFINTLLTAIFIYLLQPLLRHGDVSNSANRITKGMRCFLPRSGPSSGLELYPTTRRILPSIEALLWKSLIGSGLVMLPTVGNLVTLFVLRGEEYGWLCFTVCTVDVTWAVCVMHWLTIGSTELDARALNPQPDSASNAATDASSSS